MTGRMKYHGWTARAFLYLLATLAAALLAMAAGRLLTEDAFRGYAGVEGTRLYYPAGDGMPYVVFAAAVIAAAVIIIASIALKKVGRKED